MSTDEIPGWALEAVEVANFRHDLGLIPSDWPRVAATIVEFAPQPSAEVAPDFVDHSNWRVALTACQQERDRLVEEHTMQLAAISTAAMQNTHGSRANRITQANPYWSVAYGDVCAAIDREVWLRDERDRLREAGNRLAEALEILKGNFEKGGCSRNADYRTLVEILAHWRATTEG